MKEIIKNKWTQIIFNAKTSAKWIIFALLSGLVVGSIATLFHFAISVATMVREANDWILFLLPVILMRSYH